MTYNLADLFESVVDHVGERDAVVVGDVRRTYAELDERANRLAAVLASRDVGAGHHVGLQLVNSFEYLEGMLAAFKLRAVPINVNYRYVEGELRYLFDDAELVALIAHRQFVPVVATVAPDVASLSTVLVVEDGSPADAGAGPSMVDYEDALAGTSGERPDVERSGDDLYIVYTGGTTGMPKGVMWRHEDIFFAAMGGGDPFRLGMHITAPDELPSRLPEQPMVALATPPLMHASAHWLAFHQLFTGGTTVMTQGGVFEPETILDLCERERVNTLVIVGDAMGRPIADALADKPERWDLSNMLAIGSGGAILSPTTKTQLLELLPGRMIVDGLGSSETGTIGDQASGDANDTGGGPAFKVNDQTAVLDEKGQLVEPGSDVVGRLARRGHIPLGYYNDPEKTARTFLEVDGVRWVLPGDEATVDADGVVHLLGRGSGSINTGGEKVYPEEVEAPLKAHPAVQDALVVGVPDDRWGQRVVAVVQVRGDAGLDLDDVKNHCRGQVAGYKVPRDIVVVDAIVRSPAGKPDYAWARQQALDALT